MPSLFADDEVAPRKSVHRAKSRNVMNHPTIPPGRYRLTIDSSLRPYSAAMTVDVLRVYDDNTADIKVVSSNYLVKGSESNVPLSWHDGRRVLTEVREC
jgi:hypothetical protein